MEESTTGKYIGWFLLVALIAAVAIAVSLAVQLSPDKTASRPIPPCGGLFSECCEEWDDNWGPCVEPCDWPDDHRDDRDWDDRDRDDLEDDLPDEGLFDAEANFADRRLPSRC